MVMKKPTRGSRLTTLPSVKVNCLFRSLMALRMQYTCKHANLLPVLCIHVHRACLAPEAQPHNEILLYYRLYFASISAVLPNLMVDPLHWLRRQPVVVELQLLTFGSCTNLLIDVPSFANSGMPKIQRWIRSLNHALVCKARPLERNSKSTNVLQHQS